MSRLVIDCSVTMAWCFEDEGDAYALAVLDALRGGEAMVPSLWALEVTNVLLTGQRRGRLTEADARQLLTMLQGLHITLDEPGSDRVFGTVLSLARAHRLTAYDAAYLELAMRSGGMLCTLDEDLRRAAGSVGVTVFEP